VTVGRRLCRAPWHSYRLWQYTDSARIPGVDPGIDANHYDGSPEQLKAMGGRDVHSPTTHAFSASLPDLRLKAPRLVVRIVPTIAPELVITHSLAGSVEGSAIHIVPMAELVTPDILGGPLAPITPVPELVWANSLSAIVLR
jgi:hypothetical protein